MTALPLAYAHRSRWPVLVLVIGDLHVPFRSSGLSSKFSRLLVPGKIQQVLLTGNACDRETYEYLRGVAPDVRAVRGDWDENPNFPPSLVVQHGPIRIGVIHGHQAVPLGDAESLAAIARKMDVDVLVSGATHRFEAYDYCNTFFVNPGSATGAMVVSGAYSALPPASGDAPAEPPSPTPSFVLLDLQGAYQLIDGEVRVEKIEQVRRFVVLRRWCSSGYGFASFGPNMVKARLTTSSA